ncbi:hypothetical protein [Embleya sp. NPDC020886]|uniref:hypothetical protein n=1 Tax=Embleya sp. NPDC020886 TaxID=3363980 RepID=UPI00378E3B4A
MDSDRSARMTIGCGGSRPHRNNMCREVHRMVDRCGWGSHAKARIGKSMTDQASMRNRSLDDLPQNMEDALPNCVA